MNSAVGRVEVWKILVIGGSLLLLTVAHFTAPPDLHDLHNLLFKVTFLPLILAGLWFHVRGALVWAGLTTGAYLVHVFGQLHGHQPVWAFLADIALYNVVALTTAALSQRRAHALLRAEAQARALEENARALLQAEEAVRRGDRLRALGELAAGVAHEIRNPLGGIRGAAEVLRRPDATEAAREEFGALLESEVARLDGVVGNFLEFARPPRAEPSGLHPAEVVDAVLLLLRAEARERGVVTSNDVSPELRARADVNLLRQLLLNLCLNALQAQPGGGVLRVTGESTDGGVVIDVADAGPGVPEALRERVFDPFVGEREGGTGLGLAVAARLAQTLDGTLDLASTGAKGSVFRITLPVEPQPA